MARIVASFHGACSRLRDGHVQYWGRNRHRLARLTRRVLDAKRIKIQRALKKSSVVPCPLRYLRSLLFKINPRCWFNANGWGWCGHWIADFVIDISAFGRTSIPHWITGTTDRMFKFVNNSPRNPMRDFPAAKRLPFSEHNDGLANMMFGQNRLDLKKASPHVP